MKPRRASRVRIPPQTEAGPPSPSEPPWYVLRLFVAGTTALSIRAIANTRAICERRLSGRYQLTVVDLYQQPALAAQAQVFAAPTLLKEEPAPVRRLIGDLSDEQRVLRGLSLPDEAP